VDRLAFFLPLSVFLLLGSGSVDVFLSPDVGFRAAEGDRRDPVRKAVFCWGEQPAPFGRGIQLLSSVRWPVK